MYSVMGMVPVSAKYASQVWFYDIGLLIEVHQLFILSVVKVPLPGVTTEQLVTLSA